MVRHHVPVSRSRIVRSQRQSGVTYLWMLFLVAILSLGLGKTIDIYLTTIQREREADLLIVGRLYREAIRQYYVSGPGGVRKYPQRLEDLLRDPRHLVKRRYLRKLYLDPMTGRGLEPILAPEGGIWGVKSLSTKSPIKTSGFHEADAKYTNAPNYQHWTFIANELK